MGTYKAKCDICYTENEVPTYGDWACSECHQPYEYDEGHRIHLTDAQLEWLRQRRLTDEQREAIAYGVLLCDATAGMANDRATIDGASRAADVMRGLLERTE